MNWRRPRRCSGNSANCPEVLIADGIIQVRSTDQPEMVATFTAQEWFDLVQATMDGEFVDLLPS